MGNGIDAIYPPRIFAPAAIWVRNHFYTCSVNVVLSQRSLWKNRNELIYLAKQEIPMATTIRQRSWSDIVHQEHIKEKKFVVSQPSKISTNIAWELGPDEWFIVNTNGSVLTSSGMAAGGGLVRYRKIALQLDSQVAVSILLQDGEVTHKHGTEVLKFRELLSRDWVVKVYHIFREANKVVDFLAVGHDFNFGSHEFDCSTPDFCSIFYMINLASQYPGLS
ncbi:hypothetical protein LINPERHAP1_LOCUS21238 [Linum perenne]